METSELITINCTGCSACSNVCPANAIKMEENSEGFLFPNIDKNICVNCGLCKKTCPAIQNNKKEPNELDYVYALAGNDEIRKNSSSGGIFSLIAEYVLNNNGFVCGASYSDNFTKVEHIIISDKSDLHKLQSSKYVQSYINNVFKDIKNLLTENKIVLFSGTPCQVAGLYSFLGKDYENLITIDILCHGAPSPMVWRDYLKEITKNDNIKNVNFRDKQNGWKTLLSITYKNGIKDYFKAKTNAYFRGFINNLIVRKSCSLCKYTNLARPSDITLGDFWRVHKYKRRLNDKKGTSLFIANTIKANEILEQIKPQLKICEKVPIKYAIKGNPILTKSTREHYNRDLFFANYKDKNITKQLEKYLDNKKYDGIISNFWYTPNNYGALLTAYAIQQLFRNKGLDYRLLNYNPYKNKKKYKKSYAKTFAEKYLNLTHVIKNKKDLINLNSYADNFVAGSDQVFRDWYLGKRFEFSLFPYTDFSKKRVAFSASFGTNCINTNKDLIPIYSKCLKRFDSITVRELSGIDICKNILDVNAEHLLDPVFLVNKDIYDNLIEYKTTNYKNKIVSYILDSSAEFQKKLDTIAQLSGKEVINIANNNYSITEFLSAIRTCDYFITDSFHGTCFALLYHTPFLALKNISRGTARFDSLIETFNIKDSFISKEEDVTYEKLKQQNFDWNLIDNIINQEQEKFEEWFNKVFIQPKKVNHEQIINEIDFKESKSKFKYQVIKSRIITKFLRIK